MPKNATVKDMEGFMVKLGHVMAAVACLLAGVTTTACNQKTEPTHSAPPEQIAPFVSWYGGYKMLELLEEPAPLTEAKDLAGLLKRKWTYGGEFRVYRDVPPDVFNEKEALAKAFTLSSCEGYLAQANVRLWTVTQHEDTGAIFRDMTMMCRATQIMLTGTQPGKTYLQSLQFDKSLPGKLPVHVSLNTRLGGSSEIASIKANKSLKLWKDVAHITQVEELGSRHAIYHDASGGMQELELVAKSDFNGDKIEDMLITSRDSVVGGSYKNVRLFMLTKYSETGEVVMLNEYEY